MALNKRLSSSEFSGFADPSRALEAGDIVVVGAGLAGLYTALKLAPLPVTVVSAAPLGEGASSVWAQGGIAAAVGLGDTPQKHATDTIAAGAGLVDPRIATLVAAEGPARIRDLLKYGVPFDRDLEGHFVLSREAAHSEARVVRVSGDRAGAQIMQALIAEVRRTPSIRVLEGFEAEDLLLDAADAPGAASRVVGVRLSRPDVRGKGAYDLLPASAVIVATGGIGALYAVTTNPAFSRGEAIAFAARAGAVIADAEFVQFHPTALDVDKDPAPLASEALRGEGATLVNGAGERFMVPLHEDAELAPRDIVARGVFAEILAGRGAFLDCRSAIGRKFPTEFPTVYEHCMAAGIDPITQPIPIAPAVHYHMGGIATDAFGRTSVEGLWAVGEVASTGLHGANRLASNSLLEAVVFGERVARDVRHLAGGDGMRIEAKTYCVEAGRKGISKIRRADLVSRLRHVMSANVGVIRSGRQLAEALKELVAIETVAHGERSLVNMAVAAEFVAGAALLRKESRGGHFRADFPQESAVAERSFLKISDVRALADAVTARVDAEAAAHSVR